MRKIVHKFIAVEQSVSEDHWGRSTEVMTIKLEFIEALVALAAEFSEDMQRKVTGAHKPLAEVLWCAAAADRSEWLFNNLRWRHSIGPRPSSNRVSAVV